MTEQQKPSFILSGETGITQVVQLNSEGDTVIPATKEQFDAIKLDLPQAEGLITREQAAEIDRQEALRDRQAKHVPMADYNPMPEVSLQDRMRLMASLFSQSAFFEPDRYEAISLLNGGATMIDRLQDMAKHPPLPAVPTSAAARSDEEFLAMMLRSQRSPVRRWLSRLAYTLGDWLHP